MQNSAKQAWLLTPRSERTEGKIADLLYSPQPVSLQSLQSISEGHDDHPILARWRRSECQSARQSQLAVGRDRRHRGGVTRLGQRARLEEAGQEVV